MAGRSLPPRGSDMTVTNETAQGAYVVAEFELPDKGRDLRTDVLASLIEPCRARLTEIRQRKSSADSSARDDFAAAHARIDAAAKEIDGIKSEIERTLQSVSWGSPSLTM